MSVEEYAILWTKPFRHVLGPLPSHELALREQGVRYHPYTWIGTDYVLFSVMDEDLPEVVQKMLEAGVPIIDPLPQETEIEALTHFWTDRMHEFVLIPTPPHSNFTHNIYRLDPPGFLIMFLRISTYQHVLNRMLMAGATVLSEPPDKPET